MFPVEVQYCGGHSAYGSSPLSSWPVQRGDGGGASPTATSWIGSPPAGVSRLSSRLRPWLSGMVRWCCGSAARSCKTRTTRRMPFRPPSWSWPGRQVRSDAGTRWVPTFTVWLCGCALRPNGPGATSAARADLRREVGDRVSGPVAG